MQAFERRLFQQDQGVADIVWIGVRVSRQNLFDAGRQSKRPASSSRRTGCWLALSHVVGGRLPSRAGIVTVVPEQRIDRVFAAEFEIGEAPVAEQTPEALSASVESLRRWRAKSPASAVRVRCLPGRPLTLTLSPDGGEGIALRLTLLLISSHVASR